MTGALTPNAAQALAGIVVLLAAASAIVAALPRLAPSEDFSELRQRVRSWWIMVATFGAAVAIGRFASLAFIALISLLALREFFALVPGRDGDRVVRACAYACVPAQYVLIATGGYDANAVFVPLFGLIVLSSGVTLVGGTDGALRAVSTMNWGVALSVFALAHLGFLLTLPEGRNPAGGGAGLMLFLVFLTQFSDVVQYTAGKLFGRRRVVPRISPNKTWEGLIAGVAVTAILASAFAPWLTPLSRVEGLVAGLLIGAAGFLGDITISALKRDIGVKDAGNLIPGHGGVLDRVDSLIFAAPVFFHFVFALHYRG